MVKKSEQTRAVISELVAEADAERESLSGLASNASDTLNVRNQWRQSVLHHPAAWVASSALLGLVGARVLRPGSRQRSARDEKSSSQPRKIVLPTLSAIAAFGARAAWNTFRPHLESAARQGIESLVNASKPTGEEASPKAPPVEANTN